MSPRLLKRVGAAALVLLVLWLHSLLVQRSASRAGAAGPPDGGAVATAPAGRPDVGFRDQDRLAEHYRKHGAEFGEITEAEYLRRAQALRDRPAGGTVLEFRRGDGVVTRFDRESGDFLAFDPDLVIRTYFRPNDGEAYFRRQTKRLTSPP